MLHNKNKISTYKTYSHGFRFCKKKTYEYHKLNNLQNIKMPNKSNVNKARDVIILQQ